ncbi:MAG: acetylornithine/succinylornithine family transaminase [Alphaproteobacteria bacterium]|nr:acetylornithine/succinylornithine family transaminase [Alphaproteobacteria bacterium]
MSAEAQNIIEESFKRLIKTYNPQPVVMERGEGAYAYDTDGKKYLDFACGIAVASLGHAHPKILKTLNDQASKMMTCQASYATKPKFECAKFLVDNSCFDLVYFSNSGTESVEAALKLARKWAYDKKGEGHSEIIAFRNSFHGRTYGAASVTEKRMSQPFFDPYLPDVQFATFNDIESVKALISKKTAAVIIEPVQGEGGLTPATPKFLKDLRALCDEHDAALIFDEVQAGMGRLGTFMAYEAFADEDGAVVEPDIGAWAKGMGGGFPVGCMMAKTEFGDALVPGTHGTTYGGNPLACAVALSVMQEINQPAFLENANKVGKFFMEGLANLQRESNKITDIRGMGLMIGVDSTIDIKTLIPALQKNGLLTTQAGKGTLRLTPPLILKQDQAQEALDILAKTLKEEG